MVRIQTWFKLKCSACVGKVKEFKIVLLTPEKHKDETKENFNTSTLVGPWHPIYLVFPSSMEIDRAFASTEEIPFSAAYFAHV